MLLFLSIILFHFNISQIVIYRYLQFHKLYKISHFVRLIFIVQYARLLFKEMRISRCGLPPTKEEVRRMIEFQGLLFITYLLFAGLVSVTIITFALIIALVVIIRKQK